MTYKRIYSNNAKTTLASPITASDSSIIVADASKFTVPGANEYFTVTLDSGSAVEIVEVYGISGNVLTGCVRGVEGTTAQAFLTGTRVENRVTAGALSSFARLVDRVANITSVNDLVKPSLSTSNSYLCASPDDAGSPIVAVAHGNTWRFVNHPTVAVSGTMASTGTTTTMPLTNASSQVPVTTAGSYIIQFITGSNSGYARIINASNSTTLSWTTPLPNTVAVSDQYEIYQSSASSINALKAGGDDALIFSILFGE